MIRKRAPLPAMTAEELTVEAVLWRLEGLRPPEIARTLNTSLQAVNAALERSEGYAVPLPSRRRQSHSEMFVFPEHARVKLGIPWSRCWGTCCDVLFPTGAVYAGAVAWNDNRIMAWQRTFTSGG